MAAVAGTLLLTGNGCLTLLTQEEWDAQQAQVAALKLRVANLEENANRTTTAVNDMQRTDAQLAADNQQLARRVDLVADSISAKDAAFRRENEALLAKIKEVDAARVKAVDSATEAYKKGMQEVVQNVNTQLKQIAKGLQASAASASAQGEYVVQKGDSLALIARAFSVTPDSLRKANGLKGDMLRIGQKLTIPKK